MTRSLQSMLISDEEYQRRANVIDIMRQAAILVGKAEAMGVVLRIVQEPLKPLAMGNTRTVVDAWPMRNPVPSPKWF